MDRLFNSKADKHFIYEIYRACRLCGAGAGYKMPIIQNVIVTDGEEVELKQKIRECVQIEVHQDDKMPPLICELCVDKVNDFYEFLDMCRQTNIRTRKRLGLPMQTTQKGASDDCILGVTEPVYLNEDSNEPLSRSSPRHAKQKLPKLKKVEVKLESIKGGKVKGGNIKGGKPAKKRQRTPSPIPRTTRHSRSSNEDNLSLSSLKQSKRSPRAPPPPKSILKKETKIDDKPGPRSKRTQEPPKPAVPHKKVKLSVQPVPKPPPMVKCTICRYMSKTGQAHSNHMRSHTVTFTSSKLACNSCREWFSSSEDASTHHRRHQVRRRPYQCRGCDHLYEVYSSYQAHVSKGDCVPWDEVPDVQCPECWRYFPTNNLRDAHKCPGLDGRPGGKCAKCYRTYALLKNLKKHESACTTRRKRESYIDPALLSKLRNMQILVSRCDPLLQRISNGHYDVSDVQNYGLDPTRDYPYLHSASLNLDRMVNIKTELDYFCEEDYIHWDSELSDDEDEEKERERKVLTLSTLALKTLFSQKCLGRVPRKKRKVKTEKNVFDSLANTDFDMSFDIGNIIDNLGDDDNIDGADIKDGEKNEEQESVENVVNNNKEDTLNESNKSEETSAKDLSKESENNKVETDNNTSETETNTAETENNMAETEKSESVIENNDKISSEVTEKSQEGSETNESHQEPDESDGSHKTPDKSDVSHENPEQSDESHEKPEQSDENMTENMNKSTNNVTDSNETEKSKETSDMNENIEPSSEKAIIVYNDSTNTDLVEGKSEGKEGNIESNEKGTEQNNSACDLSINTDSVSESIADKNTDINVSENQAKIDSNIKDIKETNDAAKTYTAVIEDVDDREISKSSETEQNDTNLGSSCNDKDSVSDTDPEASGMHKNNEDNIKNDIENTENSNASTKCLDNVSYSEQKSKTNENVETPDNIANSSEVSDSNSIEKDVECETNTRENHKTQGSTDEITTNDNITINGIEEKSDKLNMDEFNDVCDSEIDDKKLMDDLNEQLGESDKKSNANEEEIEKNENTDDAKNENIEEKNQCGDSSDEKRDDRNVNVKNDDDKITLDDLMPTKDSDTRSMDLDSISDDEFNFDS